MKTERHHGQGWLALLACAALTVACAPAQQPPPAAAAERDVAADEQAVLEAHRKLIEAYQEGSIDGFSWLLTSSPDLVIFHPLERARFIGKEAAREGLLEMFGHLREAEWTEAHTALTLQGDVAWLTSEVLIESPSLRAPFLGRGTEIWVREDGGWRLVHGHWSPTPGATES